MHSNRSKPEGRSVRLLARPLGGLLQGCSTVYLGARRLKSSAKHRYQARTAPTAAGIATVVSSLSKVPQHLSAIIDADPSADGPNVDKLIQEAAEFAAWSVAAGIPTISIYDRRGILKLHARSLHIFASLRIQQFAPGQRHQVSVYLDGGQPLDDEHPRGEPPTLTVYLISEDDGRRAVASVTEALTEKVHHEEITMDDITVSLVAEQLHASVMPAPDLIVVFGPELKLSGYPPWHLQQAELETLRDHGKFSHVSFVHALRSYAGAEMRHGK